MDFLVKPWDHQLKAISKAVPMDSYGLFFEQGTGKTSTTINILRYKFQEKGRVLKTLIFGPPIVVGNWRDEWAEYSKIPRVDVVPLIGSGAKRLQTFMKNAYDPKLFEEPRPKIFLTNYESLLMENLFGAFKDWKPEALIFDESHRLKNYKSQRSKLADELANFTSTPRPLVYDLSGTPILGTPLHIFQQFKILDGGRTFGTNFFQFRGRYFRDRNAGMPKDRYFPKWEVMTVEKDGFDAMAEITRLLETRSMRVLKKDCLDLPDEVTQIIKVGMTPEQARLYKEMKNEFITFVGDRACTATIALTKALRLMQIASGFVALKPSDEEDVGVQLSIKNTPKQEALSTLLEDLTPNSKVLVWATWKENYAQIRTVCDDLKIKYVEIHGGVTPAQKEISKKRFRQDSEVRVLIGHPGSGGIGVNLIGGSDFDDVCNYSIFYSRNFSLEHWLQARSRNHRGGQTKKVTHYCLVCENTIEEIVVKSLASKQEISDKVLGDLSRELAKQEL